MQETRVWSVGWEHPLEKEWQPSPVFLPGEFHGQWTLVGYSPWGWKELDTTEQLMHIFILVILIEMLWYLIVVSVCISLTGNVLNVFSSVCYLYSIHRELLFWYLFLIFFLDLWVVSFFFFCCFVLQALFIYLLQLFSPIGKFFFLLLLSRFFFLWSFSKFSYDVFSYEVLFIFPVWVLFSFLNL